MFLHSLHFALTFLYHLSFSLHHSPQPLSSPLAGWGLLSNRRNIFLGTQKHKKQHSHAGAFLQQAWNPWVPQQGVRLAPARAQLHKMWHQWDLQWRWHCSPPLLPGQAPCSCFSGSRGRITSEISKGKLVFNVFLCFFTSLSALHFPWI